LIGCFPFLWTLLVGCLFLRWCFEFEAFRNICELGFYFHGPSWPNSPLHCACSLTLLFYHASLKKGASSTFYTSYTFWWINSFIVWQLLSKILCSALLSISLAL
jgi:hypothetical protein